MTNVPDSLHSDLGAAQSRLAPWLQQQGYALAYRTDGFVECLIVHGDEQWLGRGLTPEAARVAAVRQMFPSAAARALLVTELVTWPAANKTPSERGATEPGVADAPPAAPAEEADSSAAAPLREAATTPTAPSRPAIDVDTALAQLHLLEGRIEAAVPELALMAPLRQRLIILVWIARARAIETASGGERRVVEYTATVAGRLSRLSKAFWPGTIRALQRNAAPGDALQDLRGEEFASAPGWDEIAERAEARLRSFEEADDGNDEYGFRDSAKLTPAPRDPAAVA